MKDELKSKMWLALAYAVLLEALLAGAILFWPSFEENVESLKAMAPMQVLKNMVDAIGQSGVVAYVNGQHYFKACNVLGSLAAVLFAMGAVAGEAHRGTLETWLSRPLSRRRILSERWAAGALFVALPVFATSATIPWLLSFVDEETRVWPLVLSSAHQSLFLIGVFSLTFFLSSIGRSPILIAFAMLMFTIFEFSIYMIMDVTHWSLFRLTDVDTFARIFATEKLDWRVCIPLVAFSALCFVASQYAFARRVP